MTVPMAVAVGLMPVAMLMAMAIDAAALPFGGQVLQISVLGENGLLVLFDGELASR